MRAPALKWAGQYKKWVWNLKSISKLLLKIRSKGGFICFLVVCEREAESKSTQIILMVL